MNFLLAIALTFSIFLYSCSSKEIKTEKSDSVQRIARSANSARETMSANSDDPAKAGIDTAIIGEAYGDLTDDTIKERVSIVNTGVRGEMGIEREVRIYKKENNAWILWHVRHGGVLPSEHGGPLGDPYQGVSIERNCIVIKQMGGTKTRWDYTHWYRFQHNDWYLIGAKVVSGTQCEYWKTLDYNLVSGEVEIVIETEDCEGEEPRNLVNDENFSFENKIELPKMEGYYTGNSVVKIPGRDENFYY